MAFQDHLQNDLSIFFDEDNFFAKPITYTPKSTGIPIPTTALLDFGEDLAEDLRGSHSTGKVAIQTGITGMPKNGDIITYNATEYKVIRILGHDNLVVRVLIRSDLRGKY